MKIEKINEDKIRIILNSIDLKEKNVDIHSFVSNSIEAQELFWDMLEEAEKQFGFTVKGCQLIIEALAINGGSFILTVTKVEKEEGGKVKAKKAKVSARIKNSDLDLNTNIYKFEDFENVIAFCTSIDKKTTQKLLDNIKLYEYKSNYYMSFTSLSKEREDLIRIASLFSEFGTYVKDSSLFQSKLLEYGNVICKDNAIFNIKKHFKK